MPRKNKAPKKIASGNQSIVVGGNVSNSTIILGGQNTVTANLPKSIANASSPHKDVPQMTDGKKLIPFLCHAREDRIAVREFNDCLKKQGWIDPWFDEDDILPGQAWQESIVSAVSQSHAVVIFLSKGAVAHEGFFQKELNLALDTAKEKPEGTIFIIPIRLEECEVPMRLLPYHYVDYFGTDAEKQHVFDSLILSLKLRAEGLDIKTA